MIAMQRNNKIDVMKGMALYLVVVNHLANYTIGTNIYTQIIALIHLPILFVISGYFFNISLKKNNFINILIIKTKRLFIPYLSWSFISLLFSWIINIKEDFQFLCSQFVEIFIYARSVWFLIILYLVSIFCAIFFQLINKTKRVKIVLFVICYIVLCNILPNEILELVRFKNYLPYFVFGLHISEHKELYLKILIKVEKKALLLMVLFISGAFLFLHSEQANYMVDFVVKDEEKYMIIIAYILTIIGMIILAYMSNLRIPNRIKDIFQRMGTYSLDIYVIHMFLVRIIGTLLLKVVNVEIVRNVLMFILGFAISYIIVILKERLLNKIKIYKWINGEW